MSTGTRKGASTDVAWKKVSGNLVALLIGYLLSEIFLVPLVLPFVTIRQLALLPRSLVVLAQSSKAGIVPRDYTLILGDSYAEGQGDWAQAGLARGGRPDYGSAHVLHARTGEDVITFGVGGADSVTALVKNPVRRTFALRRFLVGSPRRVLVYFYEGNDLDDNVGDVHRLLVEGEGLEALDAPRIDSYLAREAARQQIFGWLDNFCLPGVLQNVLELAWKERDMKAEPKPPPGRVFPVTVARIADHDAPLAPLMNGPALDLTEVEIGLGLRVFERALGFGRAFYAGVAMTVVYVPSPLTCYQLVGNEVTARSDLRRPSTHPVAWVQERSREIRRRIGAISRDTGADFVEPTDAIRALAAEVPIHGPGDWKHFNELGYRRLADVITSAVFRCEVASAQEL